MISCNTKIIEYSMCKDVKIRAEVDGDENGWLRIRGRAIPAIRCEKACLFGKLPATV